MSGANRGNDRSFTDSFGDKKKMYLANWYMEDYFGEKKLLKPSLIIASAAIVILIALAIGGVV
jgi:ech hydrogenase subunit A